MSVAPQRPASKPAVSDTKERNRFSRLLLVEDNESLLFTLCGILEHEGFVVTACETAAEALTAIQREDFGVAVVDLRLPDMQGTQLLKEFVDLGSHVRVIINTAFGAFESAKDAVNYGAFAYVEKAASPDVLVTQVHRAYRSHFESYADDLEAAVAERTLELSESEKRLRLVFENAPISLLHEDFSELKRQLDTLREQGIHDFREYFESNVDRVAKCVKLVKIRDANLTAMRLHHAETKQELVQSLERIFCDESLPVFREELIALANGERSFESDAVICTLDGEKRHVIIRMFVDPNSENWSSTYIALADITQRRNDEQENERLQSQLRHAGKLDAIGQLAAGVAHEFNNILAGILGNTELLLTESDPCIPEHFTRPLNDIERAGRRAADLTQQLLSFERKKGPNVSVFDVNRLIADAQGMLQRLVGQHVAIRIELSQHESNVRADEAEIEQAIVNLALNARDAMPAGGTINLQSHHATLETSELPENCEAGDYIILTIEDDGCGMSPETVERIFEPFFSTKPVGKGTGLGLSTVFGDVSKQGGFVSVDSRLDEGTVFRIHLPQSTSTAPPRNSVPERAQNHSKQTETLLVCDDDMALSSAVALLKVHGYSVIAAQSGREAIEKSAAHDGTISLLLTDITMPEMDGRQLASTLALQRPDMKVLFTSGYDDGILKSPADAPLEFLQKPATGDMLARRIRELLDQR